MQYRSIPEFELYEMDNTKTIRHKETKRIKSPHKDGTSIRLYVNGNEVSRKIDKLFDLTFPELVEGTELVNLSKYKVRDNGDIYSKYEAKILKPATTKKGYKQVSLIDDNGNTTSYLVHQLVAKAFLANTLGVEQVNHIDGNKSNNSKSNLEWCTNSENNKHAWNSGLYDSKYVECKISFNGVDWIEFSSTIKAAEYLNCPQSTLRTCLDKNRKVGNGKYRCRGHIVLDK